jgi:uncharacterized protein DUF4437
MNYFTSIMILLVLALSGCASTEEPAADSGLRVVTPAQLDWTPLNPKRGKKGPQAATLWGDRTGTGASGFLVRFVDGFSSPPHIHNVSYRALVVHGELHNAAPEAPMTWMPTASYWTQPKGASHITSARGARNVAYVEIDEGPYLVHPPEDAFESGEVAINVDFSNLVWVSPFQVASQTRRVEMAYLWGQPTGPGRHGLLLRIPAGQDVKLISNQGMRAVVISGQLNHRHGSDAAAVTLDPGSHFSSESTRTGHHLEARDDIAFLYVRADGPVVIE